VATRPLRARSKLDDAAKIVGCWNGLAKKFGTPSHPDSGVDRPPRCAGRSRSPDIKSSKAAARRSPQIVERTSQVVAASDLDDDPRDRSWRRGAARRRHLNALERNDPPALAAEGAGGPDNAAAS
jgi:predicted helicase